MTAYKSGPAGDKNGFLPPGGQVLFAHKLLLEYYEIGFMSRILFIITQSEIGGAQRYLLELAPYLASQGHEVLVAAGEGDGPLFTELESRIMNHELRTYNIPYLVRNLNPFSDARALFSILVVLKKEQPNIVFLQSTKAGFLGSLAVKLFMIHNSGFMIHVIYRIGGWSFNDPRPWWMNKILFWMERISAPWKNIIIVNSELDRKIAIDKKIAPPEKIVKVYNGIDADKLKFLTKEEARTIILSKLFRNQPFTTSPPPAPPLLSKERGMGGEVYEYGKLLLVGAIANLYATKGIKYLIEAAHICQLSIVNCPLLFIVIGEGPERSKLEALIKKYNLGDKFFLVGRIPNASQYLKAFDIFVLPSVKEGFPWVLLEAMAAEVPIIATRVGAVHEVIEDGKDGLLVPPKDSRALAEKVLHFISVPYIHDREQMVAHAREKIKEFSLQKMLEESERLIKDL